MFCQNCLCGKYTFLKLGHIYSSFHHRFTCNLKQFQDYWELAYGDGLQLAADNSACVQKLPYMITTRRTVDENFVIKYKYIHGIMKV